MADKPAQTRKTPRRQREGRAAIVDNPRKPEMKAVRPRRISRKIVAMPQEPEPSKAKRNIMDPVPKRRSKTVKPSQLGDQVEARGAQPEVAGKGYIALRMHAEGGELQVQSAKFVEGPLLVEETVSPGLTYEAKLGRRRVGHGDVPDSIEWRSHPDPEGRAGLEGHHVVEQASFDFTVRIPAEQVEDGALDDLQVTLYRWRGKGPGEHIAIGELTKEPKAALKTLATMRGFQVGNLSRSLQSDVREAIRQAKP